MVSVKEQMAADLARLKGRVAAPSGNQISTGGKVFRLPDGTQERGPMRVVIVDFTNRNMFYEGEYDADNIQPPACFAIGDIIDDMKRRIRRLKTAESAG